MPHSSGWASKQLLEALITRLAACALCLLTPCMVTATIRSTAPGPAQLRRWHQNLLLLSHQHVKLPLYCFCRFGHYQWAAPHCKKLRPAVPGGSPAAMVYDAACALQPDQHVFRANLGMFWLAPSAAALACIVIIALKNHAQGPRHGPEQRLHAAWVYWANYLLPPRCVLGGMGARG